MLLPLFIYVYSAQRRVSISARALRVSTIVMRCWPGRRWRFAGLPLYSAIPGRAVRFHYGCFRIRALSTIRAPAGAMRSCFGFVHYRLRRRAGWASGRPRYCATLSIYPGRRYAIRYRATRFPFRLHSQAARFRRAINRPGWPAPCCAVLINHRRLFRWALPGAGIASLFHATISPAWLLRSRHSRLFGQAAGGAFRLRHCQAINYFGPVRFRAAQPGIYAVYFINYFRHRFVYFPHALPPFAQLLLPLLFRHWHNSAHYSGFQYSPIHYSARFAIITAGFGQRGVRQIRASCIYSIAWPGTGPGMFGQAGQ